MSTRRPLDAAQLGIDLDARLDAPSPAPGPVSGAPGAPNAPPRASEAPGRTIGHSRGRQRRKRDTGPLAAEHDRTLRRLEPLALVVGAGRPTFRLDHVRALAERAGVLTGQEGHPDPNTGKLREPRALAFLGRLLPGLASIGLVEPVLVDGVHLAERSKRDGAAGNFQALWRVTESGRMTGALPSLLDIETAITRARP
jgi:hypothetical protein